MPRLPAPQNVTASDGTFAGYVQITWDGVTGAGSYSVWRSPAVGDQGYLIGMTDELVWQDTTALINKVYWYGVTASASGGCSALSVQDSGYILGTETPPDPPSAPSLLVVALIEE